MGIHHEGEAVVAASVVDQHDLGGTVQSVHHGDEPLHELQQRLPFVIHGDDDGVRGLVHGSLGAAIPYTCLDRISGTVPLACTRAGSHPSRREWGTLSGRRG